MIIIYDDHIGWSYMMIIYDHHILSSCMIIIYDHHIWSSYMIIIFDHHIWSSYMIIIYDHHIWSSYMVIIYERWSYLRISGTLWDPSGSSLEGLWWLGWPLSRPPPPPAARGHRMAESRGGTGTVKSGRLTGNLLTRPSEPLQLKTVWGTSDCGGFILG